MRIRWLADKSDERNVIPVPRWSACDWQQSLISDKHISVDRSLKTWMHSEQMRTSSPELCRRSETPCVATNSLLQTPDAATTGSAGGQPLEGGPKYRNQEALRKADTDNSLWFWNLHTSDTILQRNVTPRFPWSSPMCWTWEISNLRSPRSATRTLLTPTRKTSSIPLHFPVFLVKVTLHFWVMYWLNNSAILAISCSCRWTLPWQTFRQLDTYCSFLPQRFKSYCYPFRSTKNKNMITRL